MFSQKLTPDQAIQKARHFCAYQERSHSEVKEKLYGFRLFKKDVEEIISKLIEEDYLNEERFAIAFAGGKFRMKGWGKVKIKYELKQKQVSDYCIRKALSAINGKDYEAALNKQLQEKLKLLEGEKNIIIKKRKLQTYLLQKGFESELINKLLAER